jgi:hypothetical protein
MTTITSVGSVLAGLAFWLVLVPLMVVALWWLTVAVWNLALLALECVTNGIAAALMLVWQPLGWVLAGGRWVVKRVRS